MVQVSVTGRSLLGFSGVSALAMGEEEETLNRPVFNWNLLNKKDGEWLECVDGKGSRRPGVTDARSRPSGLAVHTHAHTQKGRNNSWRDPKQLLVRIYNNSRWMVRQL